jgi:hypothetical protein
VAKAAGGGGDRAAAMAGDGARDGEGEGRVHEKVTAVLEWVSAMADLNRLMIEKAALEALPDREQAGVVLITPENVGLTVGM